MEDMKPTAIASVWIVEDNPEFRADVQELVEFLRDPGKFQRLVVAAQAKSCSVKRYRHQDRTGR